jgi:hypothetical protein
MFAFWHQIVDLSRFFGIRDRLRCPHCKAVGTWKSHGGWIDVWGHGDNAGVRRWMCKWCGLTRYKDTSHTAIPSAKRGCWVLMGDPSLTEADLTPAQKCFPVDPWQG